MGTKQSQPGKQAESNDKVSWCSLLLNTRIPCKQWYLCTVTVLAVSKFDCDYYDIIT